MADTHTYTTNLKWSDTRCGVISSAGLVDLPVATPPQFPGGIPGIWSPEHLFVASAEICLMTTFLAIAENSKVEFFSYTSEAEGTLEKTENGLQFTRIILRPKVLISDETKIDRVLRILQKAEKFCLISNSMKTTVEMEPTVQVS